MVSDFLLLLHSWTDLKYILLDFVCRKVLPFTEKKSMASSTFWWFLAIRGGKGILRMVLWWSGLLLIDLPVMMGIWGPYMDYALLMSLVVIGQFLIWFFCMAFLKVCVDAILRVSIIFLICLLLWFLVCESMTCYYPLCWGMCILWFGLLQKPHFLCQNSKDLPCIAWISSLCHSEGVRWRTCPIHCRWWSWTWTPLRQRRVCLQGIVHLIFFKR